MKPTGRDPQGNLRLKIATGVCTVLILITGVGLGGIALSWYENREPSPTTSSSQAARTADFGHKFVFQKRLVSQWHWTYKLESSNGPDKGNWKIVHLCPTFQNDAKLVDDRGKMVSYSDGKIYAFEDSVLNRITKMIINDSSGRAVYIVRTGNVIETIVNSNKVWVNMEIKDGQDEILLGYSQEVNWGFGSKTVVKDSNGNKQFTVGRNKISTSQWKWEVETVGVTLTDPRLIAMLIGKQSFSHDDDSTDICNTTFKNLYISSFVFLSLFVAILGMGMYACLKSAKPQRQPRPGRIDIELAKRRNSENDHKVHIEDDNASRGSGERLV